ncbi:MAG: hypothetical protein ABSH48_20385 [Verrucomicrobiota bacterium]|jgi:hypothetical protein
MNVLESRKQLLIAESELNRTHLMHVWRTMAGEVHALANQSKTVGSIASVVASLVAGLSSVRPKQSVPIPGKTSWWQTIAKVAGTVSTLWALYRTRPKSRPRS